MFDDHPATPQGPAPSNIPLGEPQDMFEGTESVAPLPTTPVDMAIPSTGASALNAGILKPKSTPPSILETMPQAPSVMGDDNTIKEPKLSRGIMGTIMVVVIGFVLVGSGWFVYHMFTKDTPEVAVIPLEIVPPVTNTSTDSGLPSNPTTPSVDVAPATSSSDAIDHEIIAGESPDSDGDGIKDEHEKELGTDPSNWDSDSDDLSDGEEMLIWHTNPKNADTDGDTYKDGAEVKAGYNPSGTGRLAEIMSASSTPSTPATSSPTATPSATSSPAAVSSSSVYSSSDIEL